MPVVPGTSSHSGRGERGRAPGGTFFAHRDLPIVRVLRGRSLSRRSMSIPNASVSASIATLPSARAAIPTLAAILAGRLVAAEKSSFVVAPRQDHAVLAARQEFDAARRSDDVVVGSVAADLQRFGSEEVVGGFRLSGGNDDVAMGRMAGVVGVVCRQASRIIVSP